MGRILALAAFLFALPAVAEVQAFCALNCGPDLSTTGITTPVRGPQAHSCHARLREAHDVTPGWNGAGRPR